MGKRRINTKEKIEDEHSRYVTYCKRKRGIIKKAIELSRLCDQLIFLVIFDKQKQRLVEYTSSSDFNARIVKKLVDPNLKSKINHEKFTNGDFNMFCRDGNSRDEILNDYTDDYQQNKSQTSNGRSRTRGNTRRGSQKDVKNQNISKSQSDSYN